MFDKIIQSVYASLPALKLLVIFYLCLSAILFIAKPRKKSRENIKGMWGICVKRNTTKTECKFTKGGE